MNVDAYLTDLYAKIDWSKIPGHMWPGVKMWIEHGIPGGSFMSAVMRHDFYDAIFRADMSNRACIVGWAELLAFDLPSGCHGPDKVLDWAERGGIRGMEQG